MSVRLDEGLSGNGCLISGHDQSASRPRRARGHN